MNKNVANQHLNDTDFLILTESTCVWWNNVLTQSTRFFEINHTHKGSTPWDLNETYSIFCADRLFLIVTIHNAIEYLQEFNIELQRRNDNTMQEIVDSITQVIPTGSLRQLRNMNIHHLEYLEGKGHEQNKFRTKYFSNNQEHLTTAVWTVNDHDQIYFGNINITLLIDTMKKYIDSIRTKTLEVYNSILYSSI